MIDYKNQYRHDIGWGESSIPYHDNKSAFERIGEIYKTSRRGNIPESTISIIWESVFTPCFNSKYSLPSDQQSYDQLALSMTKRLGGILGSHGVYKIGIGQKMFNLFMKDLWAWRELSEAQSKVLHLPLDRGVVNKLRDVPESWKSWSKVEVREDLLQAVCDDYIQIQQALRRYWEETGIFDSPVEMEQFLWHTIALENDSKEFKGKCGSTRKEIITTFNVCPRHDFLNRPDLNKPARLRIGTIKSGTYTYIKYDNVNIMGISCKGNYFTIKEPIRRQLDLSAFEEAEFTDKAANNHFCLRDGVGQNKCWHFYRYDERNQNHLNGLICIINQIPSCING